MEISLVTTRDLVDRHRGLWTLLTHNPLLEAVVEGTLPAEAFSRWLFEAMNGIEAAFPSWASFAAVAPPSDRILIGEILSFVLSEFGWHERMCRREGVALDAPRHPVSLAYQNHLRALAVEPYCVAAVGLWAHSRSYTKTWLTDARSSPRYRSVLDHWKTAARSRIPARFDECVDRALSNAAPAERAHAEAVFRRALLVKLELWAMILGDEPAGVSEGTRTGGRRGFRARTQAARPREVDRRGA